MVLTDHITDHAGRFLVGPVVRVAQFVHGKKHATMHRLEAVTSIGERTTDDDAHRIINVRRAHLVFNIDAAHALWIHDSSVFRHGIL